MTWVTVFLLASSTDFLVLSFFDFGFVVTVAVVIDLVGDGVFDESLREKWIGGLENLTSAPDVAVNFLWISSFLFAISSSKIFAVLFPKKNYLKVYLII